jgi:hypothetical protein
VVVGNIGLRLVFYVVLPPDHARVLQRDSIVEFTPPESLDDSDSCIAERGAEEEIPMLRLSEDLLGKRRVHIFFHKWTCSNSFFFRRLTVPSLYPTVCRDQGLVERYYWSAEAHS